MASRALRQRLTSAFSNCPRSTSTGHRSSPSIDSISTCAPSVRRSSRPTFTTRALRSTLCGLSGSLREKASRLRVRSAARPTALEIWPTRRRTDAVRLCVFLERIDVGHHDHQDVVEVVGDAAGELADRFHLLRLAKLGLQRLAMGDVDHDAAQAHDLAVGVAHRPEIALDREQRPVPSAEHRFGGGRRAFGCAASRSRPGDRPDRRRASGRRPGRDRRRRRSRTCAATRRWRSRCVHRSCFRGCRPAALRSAPGTSAPTAQLLQHPIARGDVVGRHQQRRPAAIFDRMHGLLDIDDRAVLLAMPQRRRRRAT